MRYIFTLFRYVFLNAWASAKKAEKVFFGFAKRFEVYGIILALAAFGASHFDRLEERKERQRARIVDAWQLLAIKAPGNSGKKQALETLVAAGVSLSGIDLSVACGQGVDLRGAELAGGDFADAILRGVRLDGADLSGAVLRGADLRRSSLVATSLVGAKMQGAKLQEALLQFTDLQDASLSGANFSASHLYAPKLGGASFLNDLEDADFSDARLTRVDFTKARTSIDYYSWAVNLPPGSKTSERPPVQLDLTGAAIRDSKFPEGFSVFTQENARIFKMDLSAEKDFIPATLPTLCVGNDVALPPGVSVPNCGLDLIEVMEELYDWKKDVAPTPCNNRSEL